MNQMNAWPTARELTVQVGARELPVAEVVSKVNSAAGWFWWIGGLSLVNSIATAFDFQYAMIVGLGVTQFVDAVVASLLVDATGAWSWVLRIGQSIFVAGVAGIFYLLGAKAREHNRWAFVVGMILYAVDGAIFVWVKDWISVGFHAFVLFSLWIGLRSLAALQGMPTPEGPALDGPPETSGPPSDAVPEG